MNSSRYKKIIGLALGDQSLIAAELAAGDRPQIRKLAELAYPDGITPQRPAELGQALKKFLADNGFSARQAVVGIPVKWLLVKSKDVPAADPATLANLLRLQAETDFSAELKDLVYDYADDHQTHTARSVLLLATPSKHVDWASAICESAGIKAVAVMPSALALGGSTGAALDRAVLVLTAGQAGSELTVQDGGASSAIRHLRPTEPRPPFVSELRRTVSTLSPTAAPSANADREMVVWGSDDLDPAALGEQVGFVVRRGRLGALGVDTSLAGSNGDAHKYAAAVALAVAGLSERGPTVDFLHSRLRPPSQSRVPRWAIIAAVAVIACIVAVVFAYHDLQQQQTDLDRMTASIKQAEPAVKKAELFNNTVTTAQAWHAGNPRYLACLRDLTTAIPSGLAYATTFTLTEITAGTGASSLKDPDIGKLSGHLDGKTTDQQQALAIPDRLKVIAAFSSVSLTGTTYLPRERAVSFSIAFKYDPAKAVP